MRKFITFAAALLLCAASYAAVVTVSTRNELANAIAYSSDTIRLTTDIECKDGALSVPANRTCVIDLNNFTIRRNVTAFSKVFVPAIKLGSHAKLTLINGEVICDNIISDALSGLATKSGAVYMPEEGAVLNLDGVSLIGLRKSDAYQPHGDGLVMGETDNLTVNARSSYINRLQSENSTYIHMLNLYRVTLGNEGRKSNSSPGLKVENGDKLRGAFIEGDIHGTNLSAAQLLALIPEKGSEYYTLSGEESTEVTRAQVAAMTDLKEVSLRVLQEPKFTVAGVAVSEANCDDILGDGKVRFDFLTNTLYLEPTNPYEPNIINGDIVYDYFKLNIVVEGRWVLNGRIIGHGGDLIISPVNYALLANDADWLSLHSENATAISLNGKSFCAKNRVRVMIDDNNTHSQTAVSCGMFVITNAWFDAYGKKPIVDCTGSAIAKANVKAGSLTNDYIEIEPNLVKYVVWVDAYDKNAGTATGDGYVPEGTEHTVSATPKDGYHFLRWSNGVTKNPYTFVVTQDTVLWALFEKEVVINYYDIRVASADETMGWVEGGALQLEEGQKVNIKAYPRSGYQFLYWMDSHEQVVSGKAIYEVTATNNETYTAYFRVQPPADAYNLWVRGTQVTASNSNDILGDGVWNYNHDTRVLTAMDNATYDITNDGFIEDYVTSGPLTVVLDYNIDVTCTTTDNTLRNAIYSQKGITFTGSAFHGLNLNVKNMQAGNMSGDLTITGHIDFTVFLTNTTDWGKEHIDLAFYTSKNFNVDGANVDIGTSESTYKVSNKTNDNLQVTNAEIISGAMNQRALYISDNSPKYEITYLTPTLASLCAVGGFNSYFEGTKVTLRAYPAAGYKFVQWSDGSEDNPRLLTMPAENVYLDPIVEEDGSLTPKGAIISADASEGQGSISDFTSGWYAEGTELTITAVADEGYEFVQWSDGHETNPYLLTVVDGKNISLTALFAAKDPQGIEDLRVEDGQTQKVLLNGVLYIVREGKIYNAQGANVR